jgi:hypothetical protein
MNNQPDIRFPNNEPQRIWEPGDREEYTYFRKPGDQKTIESAQEQLKGSVAAYWEKHLRNPQGGMAVLGAELGKAFIRSCQVEGDIKHTNSPGPKKYYDALSRLFGPRHAEQTAQLLGGFLGEYSLAQLLVAQRAYEVHLPNDKPGAEYEEGKGIDLWINLVNGTDDREEDEEYIGMPTQVKCATFIRELPRHVYPLSSQRDVLRMMDTVITPQNIYGTYNFEHTEHSLNKLVAYSAEFNNTIPAVALFNTPGQDADRDMPHINRVSGQMNPNVSGKVLANIEEIKDSYHSSRQDSTASHKIAA